jgi:hypothetical protein
MAKKSFKACGISNRLVIPILSYQTVLCIRLELNPGVSLINNLQWMSHGEVRTSDMELRGYSRPTLTDIVALCCRMRWRWCVWSLCWWIALWLVFLARYIVCFLKCPQHRQFSWLLPWRWDPNCIYFTGRCLSLLLVTPCVYTGASSCVLLNIVSWPCPSDTFAEWPSTNKEQK